VNQTEHLLFVRLPRSITAEELDRVVSGIKEIVPRFFVFQYDGPPDAAWIPVLCARSAGL
jgi:hypothetical protein